MPLLCHQEVHDSASGLRKGSHIDRQTLRLSEGRDSRASPSILVPKSLLAKSTRGSSALPKNWKCFGDPIYGKTMPSVAGSLRQKRRSTIKLLRNRCSCRASSSQINNFASFWFGSFRLEVYGKGTDFVQRQHKSLSRRRPLFPFRREDAPGQKETQTAQGHKGAQKKLGRPYG